MCSIRGLKIIAINKMMLCTFSAFFLYNKRNFFTVFVGGPVYF